MTHGEPHLLWSGRPQSICGRRVVHASHAPAGAGRAGRGYQRAGGGRRAVHRPSGGRRPRVTVVTCAPARLVRADQRRGHRGQGDDRGERGGRQRLRAAGGRGSAPRVSSRLRRRARELAEDRHGGTVVAAGRTAGTAAGAGAAAAPPRPSRTTRRSGTGRRPRPRRCPPARVAGTAAECRRRMSPSIGSGPGPAAADRTGPRRRRVRRRRRAPGRPTLGPAGQRHSIEGSSGTFTLGRFGRSGAIVWTT